jgi:predicted 3-demethylubiquinone-9 3-methyltransferase (glyoxalase superfamily)
MRSATPFLMFTGRAEEAMTFYARALPDCEVVSLERFGPGMPGKEGTVMQAVFRIGAQRVMCTDSPPVHAFGFTPSTSFFIECSDEAELDRLFAAFLEGGSTLMPPGAYGFSQKFGWLSDRFGVSWQFNLA